MSLVRKIGRWMTELRDGADRALMASTLSQVGEPELARDVMREKES